MAHAITIEAAVGTLNQVAAAYDRQIHQTIKGGLEFESRLPMVQADHTFTAVNAEVSDPMQPYQPAFTPNNTENWDAVENVLQHGKVDLEFTAEELEKFYDTWAPNWFELDKDPSMWDYSRVVIEQLVLPRFMDNLNEASYNGVRVEPVAGTPGTALATFDGFAKKIADAITAGQLTTIATGALASNTMHDQVRDFCRSLPKHYRMLGGVIFMSASRAIEYAEDYALNKPRTIQVISNPDQLVYRVDHFNKTIVPIKAMEGSDRMIFYPAITNNMIVGTRRGQSVYPRMRFQVFDRKLKVLSEFSRFYGFRHWDNLFVNDQA